MKKNIFSKVNHVRLNWRHKKQFLKKKSYLRKLGAYAEGVLVRSQQGLFIVDPSDFAVSKALLNKGEYALSELTLARGFLGEEATCILMGGHIGSVAIPLSKSCKKMYIFEANPRTFEYLKFNTLINECNNVSLHNLAIGDSVGSISFIAHEANSGSSRRAPLKDFSPVEFEKGEVTRVNSIDMDSFFVGGEVYDLLFMDIEGSEYFALKGGQKTLARVKTLIMEFSPSYILNVAGVGVSEFLEVLSPNFDVMIVPGQTERVVGLEKIQEKLEVFFSQNISFDNLVFTRSEQNAL
jgi:FkbM family methyltransferase